MKEVRRDQPPTLQTRDSVRPRSPAEALEPQRAPSRPRGAKVRSESKRVSGFVRVVSGFFTLILMTMVGIGALVLLLYSHFERPGPLAVTATVAIPRGEGRIEIADRLEREGVISNRWVFVAGHLMQSWFGAKRGIELKAGDYEFKKNVSMHEVLDVITEGKSVLMKLTIAEGLTSTQVVEKLRAEPNLSGDIAEIPPEGALLPDTYRFSKGMERAELLSRMQEEQRKLVDQLWEKRQEGLPFATKEQALILSSIVEKETGRSDERERVAAVFVNRLRKPMRLQSDPTIIYGIVGGAGALGRPITRSDIDTKTAYNTYQINGLPPGPICNPGRSAIEATLNPAKTNDLYFVADGSGGHTFSDTYKEHTAAVQVWRKVEKDMKAKQDGAGKDDSAEPAGAASANLDIPNPPAEDGGGAGAAAATAKPAAAKLEASTVPLPVRKPKKN